mmetsp:Transcript_8986/g.20271  ORF Transcript_8986/g.20271 Transcript_8986/m.20271 type:complete len:157 (+) Transcript_8986:158-628(+)|eukprot:CAMPEP_0172311686 /NCGR_PEP_ID=MMETSP1058-20130122/15556_1 /TAXON_ID=83371 /ORGANISM="Detonula confervacea, Strain CCMP 353" /LENGTH=156 /DNA_ID=CAMNT_0013024953 /DNA_START=84 /DNA_END=551 /DNA_ORIENTATION=+
MRNISLFFTAVGLAATASSAFHVPETQTTRTHNSNTRTLSPVQYQCRWLAAAPIAITALIFSFSPPAIASEGDITKGKEIFTSTCAGCHAGGQNFIKEKKTLQKEALEKYVGLDNEKVEAFFKGSLRHKVIGGAFDDQEITDVVTYVVDQAINDKW